MNLVEKSVPGAGTLLSEIIFMTIKTHLFIILLNDSNKGLVAMNIEHYLCL